VEELLGTLEQGDKINLLVSRDDVLMEISANMALYLKPQFSLKLNQSPGKKKLLDYWLRVL
jgi:hypothetical protein